MPETKSCDRCGAPFEKRPKESYAQWDARRFCSRACGGRHSIVDDFWTLVDRSGNGCWPWTGLRSKDGYGTLSLGRRAHRLAYESENGPIPDGMSVLHRCDNPPCCNPAHLFLGTQEENVHDCLRKRRFSSKLSPEAVREIRSRCASGERQRAVAAGFGVSEATISLIVNRKIWVSPGHEGAAG